MTITIKVIVREFLPKLHLIGNCFLILQVGGSYPATPTPPVIRIVLLNTEAMGYDFCNPTVHLIEFLSVVLGCSFLDISAFFFSDFYHNRFLPSYIFLNRQTYISPTLV